MFDVSRPLTTPGVGRPVTAPGADRSLSTLSCNSPRVVLTMLAALGVSGPFGVNGPLTESGAFGVNGPLRTFGMTRITCHARGE
ncbi:hypothetical protein [Lentzea sp. HUAS12]|uniref:hypothetical protein n=1 Tax=Lentzea sp. HUAS12 TaxID=2951806 RepID=UPI0020A1543F|nr:hypothetical protein [Lentzea sp. HUAS12]USX49109.1 hypothetical protein ND450_27115 [Lentzea sp. HUAS12]